MPLALSDEQLSELRLTASTLPVALRSDLLKLVAGFLAVEGDITDAAFHRALHFAPDAVSPSCGFACG